MAAPFLPNRNATAARMAGGVQGAPSGWMGGTPQAQTPLAPIFKPVGPVNYQMPNQDRGNASAYGTGQFRGTQGKNRYDPANIMRHQYDSLLGQENYRSGREVNANSSLDAALGDPRKQAEMFRSMYADSANAMAAPIMRNFQSALSNNAGLNMSRFGGQGGSTEQGKGEFNTADVFSRNLAEVIAGQGSNAVDAGMNFTDRLQNNANAAAGNADQSVQNVAAASQSTAKKKGGFGKFLGGLAGSAVGAAAGNPAIFGGI
jgi:hypothetical protein